MNDRKLIIGAVVIALVCAVVVLARPAKTIVQQIKGEQPVVGGSYFPTDYLSFGGYDLFAIKSSMTSATTTYSATAGKGGSIPCMFVTPAATSTGYIWMNISTATTSAITWEVSTSTSAMGYATSTALTRNALATSTIPASSLGSITVNPTLQSQNIYGPSTNVLFSAKSSLADPTTGSIGTIDGECGGLFQRISY